MKPFQKITSQVAPLPLKDIDTDMIIPAQYLTGIGSSGYSEHLFQNVKANDPHFVLTQKKYKAAEILMTRSNFGCGSSREHAVWALLEYGFRVIIAPSFADIFTSNSAKNGLVLVQLEEEVIEHLLQIAGQDTLELTVDLISQTVTTPEGRKYEFPFDPFRKECIVNGYDDLDYIMANTKEIDAYNKKRSKHIYFSTLQNNN